MDYEIENILKSNLKSYSDYEKLIKVINENNLRDCFTELLIHYENELNSYHNEILELQEQLENHI